MFLMFLMCLFCQHSVRSCARAARVNFNCRSNRTEITTRSRSKHHRATYFSGAFQRYPGAVPPLINPHIAIPATRRDLAISVVVRFF